MLIEACDQASQPHAAAPPLCCHMTCCAVLCCLQGLRWLVGVCDKGLNGILADDMGLGKTVQASAVDCMFCCAV
jgi:hypothetical protein